MERVGSARPKATVNVGSKLSHTRPFKGNGSPTQGKSSQYGAVLSIKLVWGRAVYKTSLGCQKSRWVRAHTKGKGRCRRLKHLCDTRLPFGSVYCSACVIISSQLIYDDCMTVRDIWILSPVSNRTVFWSSKQIRQDQVPGKIHKANGLSVLVASRLHFSVIRHCLFVTCLQRART